MKIICLLGHNWERWDYGWLKVRRCRQCGKVKGSDVNWSSIYHRTPQ